MAKPITVLRGTTGLNNVLDPVRIPWNPESGVQKLAVAYNVDIDETGRITRRKGYTKRYSGAVHSVFCEGGDCLFISADSLYRLNSDWSATGIRSHMTVSPRMSYVQVADEIYYANGYENGRYKDGISYVWQAGSYVGPTTLRAFSNPPVGELLEVYNSRLYIAQGKVLWYSEPFSYSMYDLARNYMSFPSRIQLVKAVADGIYVSDEHSVYFYGGANPRVDMREIKVANYPAIKGTDVMVPGSIIGEGQINTRVAMWTSPRGICVGAPEGYFINLTERDLDYPIASFGAALYNDRRKKYIVTFEP